MQPHTRKRLDRQMKTALVDKTFRTSREFLRVVGTNSDTLRVYFDLNPDAEIAYILQKRRNRVAQYKDKIEGVLIRCRCGETLTQACQREEIQIQTFKANLPDYERFLAPKKKVA